MATGHFSVTFRTRCTPLGLTISNDTNLEFVGQLIIIKININAKKKEDKCKVCNGKTHSSEVTETPECYNCDVLDGFTMKNVLKIIKIIKIMEHVKQFGNVRNVRKFYCRKTLIQIIINVVKRSV